MADFEVIGGSTALPGKFRTTYRVTEDVLLDVTVAVTDKVPRCTEIRLYGVDDGTEVAARHLRERKLENLVEHACTAAALIADQGATYVAYEPATTAQEARRALSDVRAARRRARGQGYPDDLLREVAQIYESAEEAGRYPTKAVREALGIGKSTAALYVKKAREKGFIRPVSPRKEQE